ncbi:primosomal protein N' [Isoptericola sp. NEAU-Y5]|uniref:Probable replication restart protein PriA n=1 Tax=Isoptericola luteus TaxID=2879484 RepID=A0ABS7ZM11_9MICO|nr:primosomal protein N' [Isoptericola sp. NEAU-Y5]MCA5894699.1 primosomal protein N' [Isoptericola sp. NEAU-Y5]
MVPVTDVDEPEQPALLGLDDVQGPARGRKDKGKARRTPLGAQEMATELPVARVVLDLQPAHLDREYDYLVPAVMSDAARPGVRVRARFGPQEVSGYVVGRAETSEHTGRLVPLKRLVSPDPVLSAPVLRLARAVAERYAGTLADVLRLAVPPRHARVEKEILAVLAEQHEDPVDGAEAHDGARTGRAGDGGDDPARPGPPPGDGPQEDPWAAYRGGAAFCRHLLAGGAPRAVWTPLPGLAPPGGPAGRRDGSDGPGAPTAAGGATSAGVPVPQPVPQTVPHWAAGIAQAVRATLAGGRRTLVVAPDARDVDRVCAALDAAGVSDHVRLLADDGPAPRYRAFLRARHGLASVVVGTRAAMFAPVPHLGLVVLWGDGEDTLAEPHAPYPHVREVLALRSELESAAYLLASPGRTVQAQALLAAGWAHEIAATRDVLRARAPRVRALTSTELASEGPGAAARLPTAAWRVARAALEHGPVLVQVPRTGYLPVVACGRCRTAARCGACHGPLGLPGTAAAPQCAWCGRLAGGWRCDECGDTRLRAVRVGSDRTAEELGRAFPGTTVRLSASTAPGGVLDHVPAAPALVVSTPGAEPVAAGGYAAALLLDAAVATSGTGLATATDALHRWLAAASLVRAASDGGQVLLVGDAAPAPTGALVRFDPGGLADRELAERHELGLPPAVRVAAVTGERQAVAAVVGRVPLAAGDALLGPVEQPAPGGAARDVTLDPGVRVVLRVPLARGAELAAQLRASLAVRSARREGGTVRVQLDPKEML